MDTWTPLFLFLMFPQGILAQEVADVIITVNGTSMVAETNDNFICATIDRWPHDKCNYNQCPWGNTSVLNLDLSHPFLAKAIQAFKNLRIRIGGSLQDQILYDVASLDFPCHPFKKMAGDLFGFSHGCLQMDRWDELNHFFNKTGDGQEGSSSHFSSYGQQMGQYGDVGGYHRSTPLQYEYFRREYVAWYQSYMDLVSYCQHVQHLKNVSFVDYEETKADPARHSL